MRINIKMKDCAFTIDRAHRRVICVIKISKSIAFDYLNNIESMLSMTIPDEVASRMYLPPSIVGIATCAEEDEWDEEIGKRVAYNKAKLNFVSKLYFAFNVYFSFANKTLGELAATCDILGSRMSANIIRSQQKVEEMIEQKNNDRA